MKYVEIIGWKNKNQKRKYCFYFAVYTVIFAVIMLFWLRYSLFWQGNTLVGDVDGETQFYPGVLYFGRYIREAVSGFIHTGQLSFPSWDMNIGLGDDVVGVLNQYAFGDPLDLLYAVTPEACTGVVYSVLAILRVWLAGAAFSCYGFYKRRPHSHVLCAAIVYTFTCWTLIMFFRYAYFINGLIYLPLLVLAMERMLREGKKAMFTALTAISLISSFYFFYMITIGLVIYAVYFCVQEWGGSKEFWKRSLCALWNCVFCYIKAILSIAVILIPVVVSFANSYRSGGAEVKNILLYPPASYPGRIASLFTYSSAGHQFIMGSSCLVLLAVAVIFSREKYRKFRYAVLAAVIAYLIPVISYLMNAGASDLGRWSFLLIFFASAAVMYLMPEILSMNKKDKMIYLLLVAVFVVILACLRYTDASYVYVSGITLLAGGVTVFVVIPWVADWHGRIGVIVVLLLFDIMLNSSYYTASYQSGSLSGGTLSQEELQEHTKPVTANFDRDDYPIEGYRIDAQNKAGYLASVNYGWVENMPTVSAYYSLLNGNVTEFSGEVGNTRENSAVIIQDYDDRTVLNELMSVKYLFTDSAQELKRSVPFGYKKIESKSYKDKAGREQSLSVYENQYALPILYGYDSCISQKEYERLSMNQKEQALLQGALVEEEKDFSKTKLQFDDEVIMDKKELIRQLVEKSENIRLEKNGDISVLKNNISVDIICQLPAKAESYLYVDGFDYEQTDQEFYRRYKEFYTTTEWNQKAGYWLGFNPEQRVNLVTETAGMKNYMRHNTKYGVYASFDSKVINLGYRDQAESQLRLTFGIAGTYHFEDLKVISQPLNRNTYRDRVQARKDIQVEKLTVGEDRITADIQAKGDRIVCVAVPYSTGWKAYINGKETPLEKINGMFMGFRVGEGEYSVELKYETPGQKLCAGVSGVYWLLSLFGLVFRKVRRKR